LTASDVRGTLFFGGSMNDRYHYDSDGNYIGKSSDRPPNDGSVILIVIAIVVTFIFVLLVGLIPIALGCSSIYIASENDNEWLNAQSTTMRATIFGLLFALCIASGIYIYGFLFPTWHFYSVPWVPEHLSTQLPQ
jgi:hypothetical protein